ncbi:MAG: hypothetical protein QM820_63650 [Minicystis sp.]
MSNTLRPALKITHTSTASVLARAYAVNNGMTADPTRFASPNPPLPVLQAQIAKVEDADKQARSRVKGAAKVRDLERARLIRMLENECGYVRTLCDASPDEAGVIIQAAGLVSAAPRIYARPVLKVTRGAASGTVDLMVAVGLLVGARSSKKRVLQWQWTADGGRTFTDAPPTPTGKTTILGLPTLTVVGFRTKVVTTTSPGEWSPIVSIVVH